MSAIEAVRWSKSGDAVDIVDQRVLPAELARRELRSLDDVCEAILSLAVRGAPAIGIAGAMGLVVVLAPHTHLPRSEFLTLCSAFAQRIGNVRPTAVNLSWAMTRMLKTADGCGGNVSEILNVLRREATAILEEDRAMCIRIGEHGLDLIPANASILTHCNAGALATGGIGTALAPIYLAADSGLHPHVFVDETRPLLQGSRLTAWELARAGIDITLIADNMAASLMAQGRVDLIIVGADRIAANGDVANKIGTYSLAVSARYHHIPFYVAAPWSTVDLRTATGSNIHVEHRDTAELSSLGGYAVAPAGVRVHNPAFDITPAGLITEIITDRGRISPEKIRDLSGHSSIAGV